MNEEWRKTHTFSLRIIWRGNEDKPFYRAHFASETLRNTLEERPFWGNRVIDDDEFTRATAIIDESGLPCQREVVDCDHFGYFVEITRSETQEYCFLGFSRQTLTLLEQLNTAFRAENRGPIRAIIDRIRLTVP